MDWEHGPHGWQLTVFSLLLTVTVILLAGFGVGKFFDVWIETWMFFAALTGITTTGSVSLTKNKRSWEQKRDRVDSPEDERTVKGG